MPVQHRDPPSTVSPATTPPSAPSVEPKPTEEGSLRELFYDALSDLPSSDSEEYSNGHGFKGSAPEDRGEDAPEVASISSLVSDSADTPSPVNSKRDGEVDDQPSHDPAGEQDREDLGGDTSTIPSSRLARESSTCSPHSDAEDFKPLGEAAPQPYHDAARKGGPDDIGGSSSKLPIPASPTSFVYRDRLSPSPDDFKHAGPQPSLSAAREGGPEGLGGSLADRTNMANPASPTSFVYRDRLSPSPDNFKHAGPQPSLSAAREGGPEGLGGSLGDRTNFATPASPTSFVYRDRLSPSPDDFKHAGSQSSPAAAREGGPEGLGGSLGDRTNFATPASPTSFVYRDRLSPSPDDAKRFGP